MFCSSEGQSETDLKSAPSDSTVVGDDSGFVIAFSLTVLMPIQCLFPNPIVGGYPCVLC